MSTICVTMIQYIHINMIVEQILGTDIKTFAEAHRLPLGYQASNDNDNDNEIDLF